MSKIDTAAGYPQYSGGVIPSVVRAGKILKNFYAATVYGSIFNTDYEGDISKMGDKVEIVGEPDVTIRDYKKGQKLQFENPEPGMKYLYIDQAKYWGIGIDSIDKFQSDHNYLENWSQVAGVKMKIHIDAAMNAYVYSRAAAGNSGATAGKISQNINLGAAGAPLAITSKNILQLIAEMGQVLEEQDVPTDDNWSLVLPAWMTKKIKLSEFRDASMRGDNASIMRNGRLGIVDRFTIYQSNLIKRTTNNGKNAFEVFACHKCAGTFAAQITENKVQEPVDTFGWISKGLMVYGREVLKPEALVHAHVYEGAEA